VSGKGGFTLLEALAIIFLIAIVSTIAAPNLIAWRDKARLRSAADNLKGDLELAKIKAARINGPVAIQYTANDYEIFYDSGGTQYVRDSADELIRARSLPAGIKINTDIPAAKIDFKGRGTATSGTIHLVNLRGTKKQVIVSAVGRIRIGNDQE
jgi:Tfp pilus assembly protein FimT